MNARRFWRKVRHASTQGVHVRSAEGPAVSAESRRVAAAALTAYVRANPPKHLRLTEGMRQHALKSQGGRS